MSPAFWLIGGAMTLWGGAAAGIVYVLLALMIQILAFGWTFALRASSIEPLRVVPQIRGQLGGLAQISLRQMLSTLDCYAAMLLCLSGTAYRWLAHAPSAEAFPILSMLVAVALSTVAQQMFGWETAGSMARYRLLPLAGWRLLLAKDLSYLSITGLLCLPLNVGCGMTFSLVALSLGRWTSIRQPIAQKSWRFTRGNARFGAAQLLAGMLAGLGYARVGPWFLMGAAVLWMGSLYAGQAWWNRVCR